MLDAKKKRKKKLIHKGFLMLEVLSKPPKFKGKRISSPSAAISSERIVYYSSETSRPWPRGARHHSFTNGLSISPHDNCEPSTSRSMWYAWVTVNLNDLISQVQAWLFQSSVQSESSNSFG